MFAPDIHVGSMVAPMPERVAVVDEVTGRDIYYVPNEIQKDLNHVFDHMVDKFEGVDVLVVNGDSCEGQQRADQGRYTWTNDLGLQVASAIELLSRIKAKKVYVTLGTRYHNGQDTYLDRLVCEGLDGKFGGDMLINVDGFKIHCAHFISNSAEYRTTALCKEIYRMEKICDFVIRSHLHNSAHIEINGKQGSITPCFQAKTPFGTTHGMYRSPTIGFSWIDVRDNEMRWHEKLFNIDQQIEYTA